MTKPRSSPNCVPDLRNEQSRRMQTFATSDQAASCGRVFLNKKPLDCDTRVNNKRHWLSVPIVSIFPDQYFGWCLATHIGNTT